MKFFIPTYTRVGSTLVCHALQGLLGLNKPYVQHADRQHKPGVEATEGQLASLMQIDYPIVKTHDYAPVDILRLLEQEDTYIVVCKRDFKDTLLSLILYEKNVRSDEGLSLSPGLKTYTTLYPDITDAALVNLLIEGQPEYIRKALRDWKLFTHTIVHQRVIVVDYDKICSNHDLLLKLLNKHIKADVDHYDATLKSISLSSMRKSYQPSFVRKGVANDHKNYFDDASINWIGRELNELNQTRITEL